MHHCPSGIKASQQPALPSRQVCKTRNQFAFCPAAVPPCSCQEAKAAASASADTAAKNGKAGARGRPGNGAADKGGRGLSGRGAKGGKASGIPSAIAPPQLRTAATHVTERELEQVGEGLLHNTRLATPETGAPTPSY